MYVKGLETVYGSWFPTLHTHLLLHIPIQEEGGHEEVDDSVTDGWDDRDHIESVGEDVYEVHDEQDDEHQQEDDPKDLVEGCGLSVIDLGSNPDDNQAQEIQIMESQKLMELMSPPMAAKMLTTTVVAPTILT